MTSTAHADERRRPSRTVPTWRLVHTLLGGIAAWMAHLIAMAGLNGYVCETGETWPMHLVTVVTLAIAVHAWWVGWRIAHDRDEATAIQAARMLGWLGVVLNGFNVALIVAEWIPVLVIAPCASA